MPRFVLLYHDCPPHYERPSHWDLMLEAGDKLRTWALAHLPCDWKTPHNSTAASNPSCPALAERNSVAADELGRHRREYLEFEGALSGDRGSVIRVAAGTYTVNSDAPDCWQITLAGDNLTGPLTLQLLDGAQWTLDFKH